MSIMDLLASAGQQGVGGGAPGALPADMAPAPDTGDHDSLVRDILDAVRMAANNAESEQETLAWEKVSTMIQQILAQVEKQDQDMLGGKLPPGALQRALGG